MRMPNGFASRANARPMLPNPITASVLPSREPMRAVCERSQAWRGWLRIASGRHFTSASRIAIPCSATAGDQLSPAFATRTPGGTPCACSPS